MFLPGFPNPGHQCCEGSSKTPRTWMGSWQWPLWTGCYATRTTSSRFAILGPPSLFARMITLTLPRPGVETPLAKWFWMQRPKLRRAACGCSGNLEWDCCKWGCRTFKFGNTQQIWESLDTVGNDSKQYKQCRNRKTIGLLCLLERFTCYHLLNAELSPIVFSKIQVSCKMVLLNPERRDVDICLFYEIQGRVHMILLTYVMLLDIHFYKIQGSCETMLLKP